MLLAQMVVEYVADVSGLVVGVTAATDVMASVGAAAAESSGYLSTLGDQAFTTGVGFDGMASSVAAADASLATLGASADVAVAGIGGVEAELSGVAAMSTEAIVGIGGVEAELAATSVSAEGAMTALSGFAASEDAAAAASGALITGLAVVGVGAVVAGIASTKMAADYEQSMNKVQALTGASSAQMSQYDTQLKTLAEQAGVGPQKLSEGLYNVVSAGYQGKDAMTLLTLATKDSVIGMTDASTTTKSLTALLAQFGLNASDANRVNGEMLNTVTLGSGTFEQYSSSIVKAASSASQFHIPMEAMNAAYATLTSSQIKSAQASTDLQQSYKVMEGNIGTVTKSLHGSGIAFDENKFNAMDYGHQVVYLNTALEEANSKHVKVTGVTLQAAQAINTIASHIDTYNKDLTALSDKQTMAQKTQEAWSTTVGGFNVSLSKLQSTASVVMIDIGQKLLPKATEAVNTLGSALASPQFKQFAITVGTDLINGIMGLITVISTLVGWGTQLTNFFEHNQVAMALLQGALVAAAILIGGPLVLAFIGWGAAALLAGINTMIAMAPIILIGIVIAAVVAGIILAIQNWGAISKWLLDVWNTCVHAIVGFFTWLWDTLVGHSIIPDMINGIVSWFEQLPGRVGAAIQSMWTAAVNLFNGFVTQALTFGSNIVKGIADGITAGLHWISGAITNVTQFISDHLPHSPAKMGPLMGLEQSGMEISNQISKGMVNGTPIINSAIGNMLKPVALNIKATGNIGSSGVSSARGSNQGQTITIIDQTTHIVTVDGRVLGQVAGKRIVRDLHSNGLKK